MGGGELGRFRGSGGRLVLGPFLVLLGVVCLLVVGWCGLRVWCLCFIVLDFSTWSCLARLERLDLGVVCVNVFLLRWGRSVLLSGFSFQEMLMFSVVLICFWILLVIFMSWLRLVTAFLGIIRPSRPGTNLLPVQGSCWRVSCIMRVRM